MRKIFLVAIALAVLSGCKVEIRVPEGGRVESTSGNYHCEAGERCVVSITDTSFDETFNALPAGGYEFAGWKKQWGGFCGGSRNPCTLRTLGFPGNPGLMGFLSSDETFYLEPVFTRSTIPDNQLRRYRAGDWIEFSGSGSVDEAGGTGAVVPVSLHWAFSDGSQTLPGGERVLLLKQTVKVNGIANSQAYAAFHQDASGAWVDLIAGLGALARDAGNGDLGAVRIPSPLKAPSYTQQALSLVNPEAVSREWATIDRALSVSDREVVSTPMGTFMAYRVTQRDITVFSVDRDGRKAGHSERLDETLWIAPGRGLVKINRELREYDAVGRFVRRFSFEFSAVRANF